MGSPAVEGTSVPTPHVVMSWSRTGRAATAEPQTSPADQAVATIAEQATCLDPLTAVCSHSADTLTATLSPATLTSSNPPAEPAQHQPPAVIEPAPSTDPLTDHTAASGTVAAAAPSYNRGMPVLAVCKAAHEG